MMKAKSEVSKEEEHLLLRSMLKVKWKAEPEVASHGVEEVEGHVEGEVQSSYMGKLLQNDGHVPFSAFEGRCFGVSELELSLPKLVDEDISRFKEVQIFYDEFRD